MDVERHEWPEAIAPYDQSKAKARDALAGARSFFLVTSTADDPLACDLVSAIEDPTANGKALTLAWLFTLRDRIETMIEEVAGQ